MKKIFSGFCSKVAGYFKNERKRPDKPAEQETHAQKPGAGSGGMGTMLVKNEHYRAWKKIFGGLAVPEYCGMKKIEIEEADDVVETL